MKILAWIVVVAAFLLDTLDTIKRGGKDGCAAAIIYTVLNSALWYALIWAIYTITH